MMARFCRYIEKVFDFGLLLGGMRDGRARPQIGLQAIWASAFFMFVMRRGSLNGIESDLRQPKRLQAVIGERRPSADTIGRSFALMEPESLRAILGVVNHRLSRNKALPSRWTLRFAALDGHEFFSLSTPLLCSMLSAHSYGER